MSPSGPLYVALLLLAMGAARAEFDHSGMGTAYSGPYAMDATGQNMCEFNAKKLPTRWQVYYGAMNEADWNAMARGAGGNYKKSICGKCIRVRGVKGHTTPDHVIRDVYVKIVDQCPSWACDRGNVDFSTTALEAITGYNWDKKKIIWEYTTCPDQEPEKKEEPQKKAAPQIDVSSYVKANNAAQSRMRTEVLAAQHMRKNGVGRAHVYQGASKRESMARAKAKRASAALARARAKAARGKGRGL